MQATGMVLTQKVEEHLGILPVKFGKNLMSGFREEVKMLTRSAR